MENDPATRTGAPARAVIEAVEPEIDAGRFAIKRVPGVSDVLIFGERKYAMRIWLDPARLAAAVSPPVVEQHLVAGVHQRGPDLLP